MYIDYESYLVITLVPLQFYGSYNIIRPSPTFTTFSSNSLRMAFGPKDTLFKTLNGNIIPCTKLDPENHTLFSVTYPYRQIREGPQYVTRTYLFSWVIEEEGTNRVGRFTKQARL